MHNSGCLLLEDLQLKLVKIKEGSASSTLKVQHQERLVFDRGHPNKNIQVALKACLTS